MTDCSSNDLVNGTVKSFYIRTLIEYNAESDYSIPKKGLSFEIGEILYVRNASDSKWWQAKKMNPIKSGSDSVDEGIIPSAERLKDKYSSKEIAVNFDEKTTVIEPNGTKTSDKINPSLAKGSASLDLKKKRQQTYLQDSSIKSEIKDQLSDFYEVVEPIKSSLLRPVIAIGPGRSKLYDHLIAKYPNMFASPVNHTTRVRREKEVDGIDYHFIERKEDFLKDKEDDLFVETVEYNGNHYGTSLLAVKNVIDSSRHCIIDATVAVIKNLENRGIFPITILICCDSYSVAKNLMGEGMNEKTIKNTMQHSSSLNAKNRLLFSVKLRCEDMTDLISQTHTSIVNCQKWGAWKRLENQSKLNTSCS